MPKVEKIWGLNLTGTPRITLTCRGTPLLHYSSELTKEQQTVVRLQLACNNEILQLASPCVAEINENLLDFRQTQLRYFYLEM